MSMAEGSTAAGSTANGSVADGSQPVLLAVDDDAEALALVGTELQDRYARHYRVICAPSCAEARAHLAELAASGDEVALVLAGEH